MRSLGDRKSGGSGGGGGGKREVPQHIKQFKRGQKSTYNAGYKQVSDKSNLLITVNTNISSEQLNENAREMVYYRLDDFMEEFGRKCKSGQLIKQFGIGSTGSSSAQVERYEYNIEFGDKKGLLHSHAVLILDRKAHINLLDANKFLAEYFADIHGIHKKGYINVRNYPNVDMIINAYINKSELDLD